MLILFAVIFGGILTGRLLAGRRLGFMSRLIGVIIWALLFLLGVEVGANPDVAQGMTTLGRNAFVIFAFSVAGSIVAAWFLERWIRAKGGMDRYSADAADSSSQITDSLPDSGTSASGSSPAPSLWHSLRGSVVIIAFFAVGCVAGLGGWVSLDWFAGVSVWVLYALMFSVGITLGHDTSLVGQVRRLDRRLALLPVATAVGTLAGAGVAGVLFAWFTVPDALAVGAGFGYYSLSSIFIADLRSVELGTVALLCNVMREIFTLLFAPLVKRWFGALATVSIGGATTFDTTLPIITRAAGRPYAVVSVFHGCMLDFSVPFLVTLFCTV